MIGDFKADRNQKTFQPLIIANHSGQNSTIEVSELLNPSSEWAPTSVAELRIRYLVCQFIVGSWAAFRQNACF